MRRLLLASVITMTATLAHAGAMPKYQEFMRQHSAIKADLDARKASLKKGQYDKLSQSLEGSRQRMESGVGRMVRGEYYVLADKESANLAKIRAEMGSR